VLGRGLLAFVKGFLHPHNPKDMATSMAASWYISMACQPLLPSFLQLVKNPYSPFMDHVLAHQSPFFQVMMLVAKGIIDPNYDEHLEVLVLLIFTFKKPKTTWIF
jgi:hypothetical protein